MIYTEQCPVSDLGSTFRFLTNRQLTPNAIALILYDPN